MKDLKEITKTITTTANYYQVPVDEVLKWIKNEIINVPSQEGFHYKVNEKLENKEEEHYQDMAEKLNSVEYGCLAWRQSFMLMTQEQRDRYIKRSQIVGALTDSFGEPNIDRLDEETDEEYKIRFNKIKKDLNSRLF